MLRSRSGGIGLIKPVRTRWIYWYYVFDRLLSIKRPLCDICEELNIIHDLNPGDWDLLRQTRDVFAPFAAAVTRLEGEHYTTISEVYPVLFSIKDKFEGLEVNGAFRRVLPMLRRLKRNLDFRFARIYIPTSFNFDPLYVLFTYLDPRYALLLHPTTCDWADYANRKRVQGIDGELLDIAKRELKLLNDNGSLLSPTLSDQAAANEGQVHQSSRSDDLLSVVRAKISERQKSYSGGLSDQSPLDIEQGVYVSEMRKLENHNDAFAFWSEQKER